MRQNTGLEKIKIKPSELKYNKYWNSDQYICRSSSRNKQVTETYYPGFTKKDLQEKCQHMHKWDSEVSYYLTLF